MHIMYMYIYRSDVWLLYSWANHDTCTDILLHSRSSKITSYFVSNAIHTVTTTSKNTFSLTCPWPFSNSSTSPGFSHFPSGWHSYNWDVIWHSTISHNRTDKIQDFDAVINMTDFHSKKTNSSVELVQYGEITNKIWQVWHTVYKYIYIYKTEIISKSSQYFISHVTTSETEIKH